MPNALPQIARVRASIPVKADRGDIGADGCRVFDGGGGEKLTRRWRRRENCGLLKTGGPFAVAGSVDDRAVTQPVSSNDNRTGDLHLLLQWGCHGPKFLGQSFWVKVSSWKTGPDMLRPWRSGKLARRLSAAPPCQVAASQVAASQVAASQVAASQLVASQGIGTSEGRADNARGTRNGLLPTE
jgi:hypothetical protein